MRYLICVCLFTAMLLSSTAAFSASARCEVVKKQGNVLIMDCGERAEGFNEKSQVKIKTDRDRRDGEGRQDGRGK